MKKLFAILIVTTIIASCNDTDNKAAAEYDSARAAATEDSLAAIKALADTIKRPMDTSISAVPNKEDSLKK